MHIVENEKRPVNVARFDLKIQTQPQAEESYKPKNDYG